MKYQSTPVRFNKLKDGATGTGVESITAQYYVSTSKTTQTGGSWVETMPTWAVGTYLWIRNKIIYKDPASTEYTEPYCDSSWEVAKEVQDNLNTVQDNVNEVQNKVVTTELNIDTLKKQISALVSDENGYSLMTQTSTGWVLNMGDIYDTLDATAEQIDSLSGSVDEVDKLSKELNTAIEGLSNKTSYLSITEDTNGQPCIELGQNTSDFKVRITNTAVDFMEGTSRIAYINNKTLYIEKAIIKTELHIGEGSGFVIAKRANGNVGFRWKESD